MVALAYRWENDRFVVDPDAYVVPEKFIGSNRKGEIRSKFSDDEINVYAGIGRVNVSASNRMIDLKKIDNEVHREICRVMIYVNMNFPRLQKSLWTFDVVRPASIENMVERTLGILRWLDAEGVALHEVNNDVLSRWLGQRSKQIKPSTLIHEVIVWRRIWLYRDTLPIACFQVAPWGSKGASKVAKWKPSEENLTPRVPEEIHQVMLRWSVFFVETAGQEIISSREKVGNRFPDNSRKPIWVSDARLDRFLNKVSAGDATLTIHPGGNLNLLRLSNDIGVSVGTLMHPKRLALLEKALNKYGGRLSASIDNYACLPGTNMPWCDGMSGRDSFFFSLATLTACYFIIGFLSGMRDSEATALKVNSAKALLDSDGKPYRYVIEAVIFKGANDVDGVKHTWIVPEIVMKAYDLAVKLQEDFKKSRTAEIDIADADLLFVRGLVQEGGIATFGESSATKMLRVFAARCNSLAMAAAKRAATTDEAAKIQALWLIPDDPETGLPWSWTTRQLRRTFAWFIANRPFGIVAGALQYGHAYTLSFEGYAGTSESGFPAEVELEQALKREADIVEAFEDYQQGKGPSGPHGRTLATVFGDVIVNLGELPGTVAADKEIRQRLKSVSTRYHAGFLNDCVFYVPQALCTMDKDATSPNWGECDRERCPNACVSERNRRALKIVRDDAVQMQRLAPAPNQKRIIGQQIKLYDRLLALKPGLPIQARRGKA